MLGQSLWQREPGFAEAWNFGPHENAISVEAVARYLIQLWGAGKLKIEKRSSQPHEAHYLKLDCTKARDLLGWRSWLMIEYALRLTVAWYHTVANDKKISPASTPTH